jgi:hypothetical protein
MLLRLGTNGLGPGFGEADSRERAEVLPGQEAESWIRAGRPRRNDATETHCQVKGYSIDAATKLIAMTVSVCGKLSVLLIHNRIREPLRRQTQQLNSSS